MVKIGESEVKFIETLTVRQGQLLSKFNNKLNDKEIDYDNVDLSNDLLGIMIVEIDGKTNKEKIMSHILDGGIDFDLYPELIEKTSKQLEMLQKKKKAQ